MAAYRRLKTTRAGKRGQFISKESFARHLASLKAAQTRQLKKQGLESKSVVSYPNAGTKHYIFDFPAAASLPQVLVLILNFFPEVKRDLLTYIIVMGIDKDEKIIYRTTPVYDLTEKDAIANLTEKMEFATSQYGFTQILGYSVRVIRQGHARI